MELINEIDSLIQDVSKTIGKPIVVEGYEIIDRGLPHKPKSLPIGMMGVYAFWYNDRFLKIGKAGSKSGPRFLSQHYNPKSAQSTLAASILRDPDMLQCGITEENVGVGIKENSRRIHIVVNHQLGIFTLVLVEVVLHYKYGPECEDCAAQR